MSEDDPYDFPAVIKGLTKARAAILAAEDRPPRVEFRAAAEDADVLVSRARSTAAAIMKRLDMPLLFCVLSARAQHVVPIGNMPGTRADITRLAALLRLSLISAPIDAYWLASEAWMASYEGIKPDEIPDADLPSNRPDREEALVISVASRSFHRLKTFHTRRKGRDVTFAPADYPDMTTGNPALRDLFDNTTEDAKMFASWLTERVAKTGARS